MKSAQNVSLLEQQGGPGLPGAGVGMGVNCVWAPDTSYSAEGRVQNCGAGASSSLVNYESSSCVLPTSRLYDV